MITLYTQPDVNIAMMPQNAYLLNNPIDQKNTPEAEIERCGQAVMKGAQKVSVERKESCIQCYWDFREVDYDSHLGQHKVKRFQPNFINLCFCWPLKMCCCSFTIPPHVSNDVAFNDGIEIKFANRYHGFITAKGIALGTLTLDDPSCCSFCCLGTQPTVVIRKAVTNETFTMKANDNYCQVQFERSFGCFAKQKEMFIEKGGQKFTGNYYRSCGQAIFNFFTCNSHFYNKLDLDFQNFVKSDADKVLLYGAFLFLQENTNKFRGCFF